MDQTEPSRATDTIYAVVKYIMEKQGKMTASKLHKLLYYCQAWSLVWDEEPLFEQRIEAWANGPVVPAIYQLHKGQFIIEKSAKWFQKGEISQLTKKQKETIDAVLKAYGCKDSEELSRLTHEESPWQAAREGVPIGERSSNEIKLDSMADYYSGLL